MRENKRYSANELNNFIQFYLKGTSYAELVEAYGLNLSRELFTDYVRKYQVHGPMALESKSSNNSYASEFKAKVVNEYLTTDTSYRELALKYKIPIHETVRTWILKYTNGKENQSYSPKPEVYTMKSRKTISDERIKS